MWNFHLAHFSNSVFSRAGCAQSTSAPSISTDHRGADVGTDSAASVLRRSCARSITATATTSSFATPPHVDQRPPWAFGSGARSPGLSLSMGGKGEEKALELLGVARWRLGDAVLRAVVRAQVKFSLLLRRAGAACTGGGGARGWPSSARGAAEASGEQGLRRRAEQRRAKSGGSTTRGFGLRRLQFG